MHSGNISQGYHPQASSFLPVYSELSYCTVDISKLWENAVLWNANGPPGIAGLLHEDLDYPNTLERVGYVWFYFWIWRSELFSLSVLTPAVVDTSLDFTPRLKGCSNIHRELFGTGCPLQGNSERKPAVQNGDN